MQRQTSSNQKNPPSALEQQPLANTSLFDMNMDSMAIFSHYFPHNNVDLIIREVQIHSPRRKKRNTNNTNVSRARKNGRVKSVKRLKSEKLSFKDKFIKKLSLKFK